MKSPEINRPSTTRLLRPLLLFYLPLILAILACTNPLSGDQPLQETQAALAVQSTFDAERSSTLNAQQTSMAVQVTQAVTQAQQPIGGTLQAQQATMAVQQTTIAGQNTQVVQPTATPVAPSTTTIPETSSTPMILTDFKFYYFVQSSTDCRESGDVCWIANDQWTKDRNWGEKDMVLTTKGSIFIDPNWKNPYLVFWHIYKTEQSISVVASVDSKKEILWFFTKSSGSWAKVVADLTKYKGKDIVIQFVGVGRNWYGKPKTEWTVQDIQIVPNYTPTP
jgi:hypothetical protein